MRIFETNRIIYFFLQIETLADESKVVTNMYRLIEQYAVPAPPEDIALFHTMKPSIIAVYNAIDKSVAEREATIVRFCQLLDLDIHDLNEEVKIVKRQSEV